MPLTNTEIRKIKKVMKESLIELIETPDFTESILTMLKYVKIGDSPKVGSSKAARIIGMSRSWVQSNKEVLHAEKVITPTGKVKWLYDSAKIIGYLNEYRQRYNRDVGSTL